MKKIKVFAAFLSVAILIMGCSGDDNSSEEHVPINKISVESYSAGKTVRNKVVSLDNSVEYYEYLTFTSKTEGKYSLYKVVSDKKTEITTYTDRNNQNQTVPTSFTYDSKTGKFTAENVSSYLFSVNNESVIASELLVSEEKTIYSSFKNSSDITFKFNSDGTAEVQKDNEVFEGSFTEKDGWINLDFGIEIPFFWSSDNEMYYFIYKTEREIVETAGRSINEPCTEINLLSSRLLLVDMDF